MTGFFLFVVSEYFHLQRKDKIIVWSLGISIFCVENIFEIYNEAFFSHNKKGILLYLMAWKGSEGIILTSISQRQYDLTSTCNLK